MPKKTAEAGTYILTGTLWSRTEKDGTFTDFEEGDEVELTAAEATRLMTGPIVSFRKKDNKSDSNDDTPDPGEKPTTFRNTV